VSRPALFLDRDGVINHDCGYLHSIADCRFMDGIFPLARTFAERGFAIVIATNQSGIGRGYYTEDDFQALMTWMRGEFRRRGTEITAVYHCPDHPTEGIGRYRQDSPWRKPQPGMFLAAARDHGLDLAASWSIGDKESDTEAGRRAGIGTLVRLAADQPGICRAGDHWVAGSLRNVQALLARHPPGAPVDLTRP
jgi:D-glycero-D-manno-heptose 1,7-bisphosphate phosphatase